MKEIHKAPAGLPSLESIEKSSLKPQIEPITPLTKNKPQVLKFIVKIGKFIVYVITYACVACIFYCIYVFYLLPLCQSRTCPSPAFMTISMSVPSRSQTIINSFCSHPQNPSAVHCSISQGVLASPRSMSYLTSRSHGSMLWTEEPKDLKERVVWKERLPSDPPCLPIFPRRRFDKNDRTREAPVQRAKMVSSRRRFKSTNHRPKNKIGLSLSSFISRTRTMPLRKQNRLRVLRKKIIRIKLEEEPSPSTDKQSQNQNPQYLLLKKEYITSKKSIQRKKKKNWVNLAAGLTYAVVYRRYGTALDEYITSAICVYIKCQMVKWQTWLPLLSPHFQQTIKLQRSIRHFGYTILISSKQMLIDEKRIIFYAALFQIAENIVNIGQTTLKEFATWLESDINIKINSKIIMVFRSDFQKKQDSILANIQEHKGLELLVRNATIRDTKSLLQRVGGSSNRFQTLEKLWTDQTIKQLETVFFRGSSQSLYDYIWATLYLSTWHPELPISTGMPQSMQRFLDRTGSFMNDFNLEMSRISILEKTSSSNPLGLGLSGLLKRKKRFPKAEQYFAQLKIWARAVPFVRTCMIDTSTQFPSEEESFWKLKEREFIPACFRHARQICQNEMGINLADEVFEELVKGFIDLPHEDYL
nr:hypothetical protein [Klebsormidium nitens]